MSELLFSLNLTLPIFLLMIIGMVLKKIDWISDDFAQAMNKFVFRFALPVSIFKSMANSNFKQSMDFRFVIFCALVSIATIMIATIIAQLFVERRIRGEFIQASFRPNTSLLGMAMVTSIYNNSIYAPLMLLGSVPILNIFAVVILTIYSNDQSELSMKTMKKVLIGILKNPIIIGLVIGVIWSVLEIPYPELFSKEVNYIAGLSTPLGLMAMGATFKFKEAVGDLKPALIAVFLKLIGYTAIFLPIAMMLGYKDDAILSILIMLGASQAVASYSMAKNMGHKGILTSTSLMLTTLLCGFTLTFWIFILRMQGLL